MKKKSFFKAVADVFMDIIYRIKFAVVDNIYNMAVLMDIVLPYVMMLLGAYCLSSRGYFAIGGEVALPVIVMFISSVLKHVANEEGRGDTIPTYYKRFTTEHEDGEITIEQEDVSEIILYLNDVENYIEKRGLKKWEK